MSLIVTLQIPPDHPAIVRRHAIGDRSSIHPLKVRPRRPVLLTRERFHDHRAPGHRLASHARPRTNKKKNHGARDGVRTRVAPQRFKLGNVLVYVLLMLFTFPVTHFDFARDKLLRSRTAKVPLRLPALMVPISLTSYTEHRQIDQLIATLRPGWVH
jgi:hypothetical protein